VPLGAPPASADGFIPEASGEEPGKELPGSGDPDNAVAAPLLSGVPIGELTNCGGAAVPGIKETGGDEVSVEGN